MIAKANTISHGANAIRYSVNKDRVDIVKNNLLPEDISPEAMYQRMMLVQKKYADQIRKGRPLDRNVIRIEISPSKEESRNWTMEDWERLADEFVQVLDSIDLSRKTGRASSKQTNLKGSQYVVALHRDAKSGILHLHIDANRVDMDGKTNDGHKIGERAVMAASIINERRGWVQAEKISDHHKEEISRCCIEILKKMESFSWEKYEAELKSQGYGVRLQRDDSGKVCGYSTQRGNSSYKSSKLSIGRKLTPLKIENTWRKLHPEVERTHTFHSRQNTYSSQSASQYTNDMKLYDIPVGNRTYHCDIPKAADDIIRQECSLKDTHSSAMMEDIIYVGLSYCSWVIPILPQTWHIVVVVEYQSQEIKAETKMRMTLNGHTVVPNGLRSGADAEEVFVDKQLTHRNMSIRKTKSSPLDINGLMTEIDAEHQVVEESAKVDQRLEELKAV